MIALVRRWWKGGDARIGEAVPADASALAALHAASFRRGWSEEEFERLLVERNVVTDMAAMAEEVVGFVMTRQAVDEAEILSVAVAPSRRGRGIAGRLLAVHLGRLAAAGVERIFLEVDKENLPARRLYDSAGFAEVGQRPGYYDRGGGPPAVALVLRRDLA
ncbi:ribosomal protein S18-alanine N-acetyltransferase [Rhodoplanes roseus]|uniref:Ribosomal-protein-alanine N-acetyltransferase n=1 Tax=Rhodoplanes roseus TaxID=29409 RepID=A0A327KQ20_9BRAD|nr:ribosomal protein S18-alanine N-acetyltransferase [Rhodoplanes roseus]RAI40501.1 ribosomal-protein-alanine N-acetyltransferase [Rhodoplanes roseus]